MTTELGRRRKFSDKMIKDGAFSEQIEVFHSAISEARNNTGPSGILVPTLMEKFEAVYGKGYLTIEVRKLNAVSDYLSAMSMTTIHRDHRKEGNIGFLYPTKIDTTTAKKGNMFFYGITDEDETQFIYALFCNFEWTKKDFEDVEATLRVPNEFVDIEIRNGLRPFLMRKPKYETIKKPMLNRFVFSIDGKEQINIQNKEHWKSAYTLYDIEKMQKHYGEGFIAYQNKYPLKTKKGLRSPAFQPKKKD